MKRRPRTIILLGVAWAVFSFLVASYHPPRTLADRVLVRAERYDTWRFDPREDMRTFVLWLVPGLAVGGILLWRSQR